MEAACEKQAQTITQEQTDYRRGRVPRENKPNAMTWETSKWKNQLDLEPFNTTNEIKIELWFERAASKIQADQPDAKTILNVMKFEASDEIQEVLRLIRPKEVKANYLKRDRRPNC